MIKLKDDSGFMHFQKAPPSFDLARFVECYWMITDDSIAPRQQKIVPDGFPEIIVHLADPYKINIDGQWAEQSQFLIAGQLRKYFYLENTGTSAVFGIKLKPAALTLLFEIDMSQLTDSVFDFDRFDLAETQDWKKSMAAATGFDQCIQVTESFLSANISGVSPMRLPIEDCLDIIFSRAGACSISDLASVGGVGTRQLELYFKKFVGLSPKFFSRVVRFSKIFTLIQENKPDWPEIAHLAGYFDQAHFIRNFKAFTGEEPSRYGFNRRDFANFFLMKNN
jgi:AraC-like DNA-binding protein